MNIKPYRKILRLYGYDYSQKGCYFITICTYSRQKLFGAPVGATLCGRPETPAYMIQKWLLEIENKFPDVKICEYIIMPDHIHFIISKSSAESGDHAGSPLQDVVGWFKTMTTNDYISRVKTNQYLPFDKKIWQRSYYDRIIRSSAEYKAITKYILSNPYQSHTDPIEKFFDFITNLQ